MTTLAEPITYQGKTVTFPLADPAEADVPNEILHESLSRPTTERTKRLKARCRWKHASGGEFIDKEVRAGIERMRFLTEAHKESVGQAGGHSTRAWPGEHPEQEHAGAPG